MGKTSVVEGWPGLPSFVVLLRSGNDVTRVNEAGDLDTVRPWASVSKMAVALAAAKMVDRGDANYGDPMGPLGATLAHLLSHSAGLGFEVGDPVSPVGAKRLYSNYGIDIAVQALARDHSAEAWLNREVLGPLSMSSTHLVGRASAGLQGSTNDLVKLARGWLTGDQLSAATRDVATSVFLPDLAGIVPGFGRFSPCPWSLGPEVRGDKQHWMGDWPSDSVGHFGQSGALMLLNIREGIGLVATSTELFGPWAVQIWPTWTSSLRSRALSL